MKPLSLIAAAIVIIGAGPAWAQTILDRAVPAMVDQPTDVTIRQLFDKISAQFVEVGGASFLARSQRDVDIRAVATMAKPAGNPGLCEATVATLRFAGAGILGIDPPGIDPLTTHKAFKVVGSLAPLPYIWSSQYAADLTAKCAHAGRVLSTGDAPFDQEMFFVDETPRAVGPWFAARALEIALQQARDGAIHLNCGSKSREDDGCREALSGTGTLRLQRLLKVDAKPCQNADPSCFHVTGEFLDTAGEISGQNWVLDVDATETVPRRNERDVGAVADVKLGKSRWIF
jgi:hypothetical protein